MLLLVGLLGCGANNQSESCTPTEFDITAGTAKEIIALEEAGSGEWDDKVQRLMLQAYDLDKSGGINTEEEVAGIPCETFYALDRSVIGNSKLSGPFYVLYGFPPDYIWVDALGFDETIRAAAWERIQSCGMCDA